MASPIETIKQGIQAGDWARVVAGYNRLSGEKLKRPARPAATVDNIRPEDLSVDLRAAVERPLVRAISEALDVLNRAIDTDQLRGQDARPGEGNAEEEEEEEEEEAADPPPRPAPARPPAAAAEDDPDSDEARARDARAILRGDKPPPDFTHVHTGRPGQDTHDDLGVQARGEPHDPTSFRNEFVDDGKKFRGDITVDRRMLKGLRPTERRPPVRKVKVQCFKCDQHFRVDPDLVPRPIKAKGVAEKTHYVCDGCMRRAK